MREILFRGKRVDNGEWIEGYYIGLHKTTYCFEGEAKRNKENEIHQIVFEQMTDWDLPNKHLRVDVIPETIGQYTGLTDKNGKKIFEGDIVKDVTVPVQCGIGIVKFGKYETRINHSLINDNYAYHIGVYIKWNKTLNFYRKDLDFWNEEIEVIGNIHDNPEFLK